VRTTLLLLGAAPTRIHLFKPHKPPNQASINQEHTMDWIIWIIILAVFAAIVGGILALIVLGIRRLMRKNPNG
jgi:hypothetical protein